MKRTLLVSLVVAAACSGPSKKPAAPPHPPDHDESRVDPDLPPLHHVDPPAAKFEVMDADTPRTTAMGSTFIAPAGWKLMTRDTAVVLTPPEDDSHVALVDSQAKDADAAVAAAWAIYDPSQSRKLQLAVDQPTRDGWDQVKEFAYETSPNENRVVAAVALRAGAVWTVVIVDISQSTGEKRGGQFGVVFGRLLPKGGAREMFTDKEAHPLDAEHVKMITDFVEDSRKQLDIPGVAIALIDHDKVVFEGGFGVRELGKKPKIDKDTRFIVASNTKAMTTLLLARLVDQGKVTWDTQVTQLYPDFKLGDADTTKQVLLKHLVCACTGLPRQDFEWLFEFAKQTPLGEMALLGTIQPTSKFGEMFQYSNGLAAAAGFVGGHVMFPKKELGAAYDAAMQAQVFGPLGMKGVTFDFKKALAGNHAGAHGLDVDGKTVPDLFAINYAVVPLRPAGGLWASVHDMARYVRMELANGKLDGKPYIGEEALLTRRVPNVAIGTDATYGMGLMVDKGHGVTVVHHGGDLIGYHSDMMWLPDQQIGAIILTNSDVGPVLVGAFRRRLLEVVFDGKPQAVESVASAVAEQKAAIAAERPHLVIPADATAAGALAKRYSSPALGTIDVRHDGKATLFDFGEWKSEVATRKNEDGTTSFITVAAGINGIPFVAGTSGDKPTLTLRDAQHEYVFTAAD